MTYPERSMNPDVERELNQERRARLLNLDNPDIRSLWNSTRKDLESIAKPGVDLDQIAENFMIRSLQFAYKDQLSQVGNRTELVIELEAAAAVARKLGIPLTVFNMDGRGFKEINDILGHHVGDKIVAAIGEGMKRSARRSTDINLRVEEINFSETDESDETDVKPARQGGDEFAAVLLNTDAKGAEVVRERMRKEIQNAVDEMVPEFRNHFGRAFEITIGMAQFDPSIDQNGLDVLKRADADISRIRAEQGQTRRG